MITVKKGDYIIILCSLLIALIPLGTRVFRGMPEQRKAVVTVSEEGRVIYKGRVETDHIVETSGGSNRIVIRDGDVYMEYADCRDQVCVKEGKAKPGKPLVCLPNHVIVTVSASDGEPDYDAISK